MSFDRDRLTGTFIVRDLVSDGPMRCARSCQVRNQEQAQKDLRRSTHNFSPFVKKHRFPTRLSE
jgi:hypothetical protein